MVEQIETEDTQEETQEIDKEEIVLDLLFKKSKVEDLLFTTINKLENKEVIVLFQGDSYMEQLTIAGPGDNRFLSAKLVQQLSLIHI